MARLDVPTTMDGARGYNIKSRIIEENYLHQTLQPLFCHNGDKNISSLSPRNLIRIHRWSVPDWSQYTWEIGTSYKNFGES